MNAGLEDVLKVKERELKLHQRFLNLKAFSERKIFAHSSLPLETHTNDLKEIIEALIPEPKERSEEMFSGEIFSILGAVYLHDARHIKSFEWDINNGILSTIDGSCKDVFMNFAIGRRLDIPPSAIEIINYLMFSHSAKRLPVEWAITEGSSRAIVRSPTVFASIFNFAHLLCDLFRSDLISLPLKRYVHPQIILNRERAKLDIDSVQGTIGIEYNVFHAYELHSIENAKRYLNEMFRRFQEHVNGRMGLQYKKIEWKVSSSCAIDRSSTDMASAADGDLFGAGFHNDLEMACTILDKLFEHGYVLIAGSEENDNTAFIKSVVMKELAHLNAKVLYCELWSHPAQELRDIICAHLDVSDGMSSDVISLCKILSDSTPCVFVIDSMERLSILDAIEREKLVRFMSFCLKEKNIFLMLCGDREFFFNWCNALFAIDTDAIHLPADVTGKTLLQTDALTDLVNEVENEYEFRSFLSCFVDTKDKLVGRHAVDEIHNDTLISRETIHSYASLLLKKNILRESVFQGHTYFSLAGSRWREILKKVFKLGEFEARRNIRDVLKDSVNSGVLLDKDTLDIIDRWKERMIFERDENGIILASLVDQGRDYDYYLEKARRRGKSIDVQPIIKLVHTSDVEKRAEAIILLTQIGDKSVANPLVVQLKNEEVSSIRDLVVKGVGHAKRKRTAIAVVNAL
ncbi:MAG TPA: hypothetical protein VHO84_04835, partial [Syntrophorhabdaceae bacterium]|nr:hypothetical protein [Syntrophorhabdaceae bacterium]